MPTVNVWEDNTHLHARQSALRRDESGMAVNQEAALANLDPRSQTNAPGVEPMGTSTHAVADDKQGSVPDQGIGVSRGLKVESQEAVGVAKS